MTADTWMRGGPRSVSSTGSPAPRSILLNTRVTGTSAGRRARSSSKARPSRIVGRVDDEQHAVGARHFGGGAAHALALDDVVGVAQAGGVEHVQRQAVDVDAFAQHVARGARDGGDDGGVVTGQPIEQAGFAGVGPAREHDGHAVAQQAALPGRGRRRASKCPRTVARRSASSVSARKSTSSSGKSIAAST